MTNAPAPGSGGNVLAALCSFVVPGLGQLLQGRIFMALVMFVLAGVVWVISFGTMGWIVHIVAAISAALYRG